jgi:hypothetical protein
MGTPSSLVIGTPGNHDKHSRMSLEPFLSFLAPWESRDTSIIDNRCVSSYFISNVDIDVMMD